MIVLVNINSLLTCIYGLQVAYAGVNRMIFPLCSMQVSNQYEIISIVSRRSCMPDIIYISQDINS